MKTIAIGMSRNNTGNDTRVAWYEYVLKDGVVDFVNELKADNAADAWKEASTDCAQDDVNDMDERFSVQFVYNGYEVKNGVRVV